MFDAIDRAAGLPRDIGQANPHQYGAGNVIALAAGLAALAALNTRELLRFTMKLVSRPEELHLQPLAERCVSLSTHTAPIRQTHRSSPVANVRTTAVAASQCLPQRGLSAFYVLSGAYTSASPRQLTSC